MWLSWVGGKTQAQLAAEHGISQQAVSQALARYRETLPVIDRAAELRKAVAQLDALIQVHLPKAEQGHLGATRMVDRLTNTKMRLLGLEAAQVLKIETDTPAAGFPDPVEVERGKTVEQLLEQWRAEGKLRVRGELVRLDQEAGP